MKATSPAVAELAGNVAVNFSEDAKGRPNTDWTLAFLNLKGIVLMCALLSRAVYSKVAATCSCCDHSA
jgi:hypothetical protein